MTALLKVMDYLFVTRPVLFRSNGVAIKEAPSGGHVRTFFQSFNISVTANIGPADISVEL